MTYPDLYDEQEVRHVSIRKVLPDPDQPRKSFSPEGIAELAESIAQYGILQPLLVRDKRSYYQIVAGERRWRAAKEAGLEKVPVIIRDLTDSEVAEIALIENIQRENLNAVEEARAYKKLVDDFGLSKEEVARRVAKNRSTVSNSIRLLALPDTVLDMVVDGDLSEGHARALLMASGEAEQIRIAGLIKQDGLTVREAERLCRKKGSKKRRTSDSNQRYEAIQADLEHTLEDIFGTKVSLQGDVNGKGRITFEYYSSDDLERLYEMFLDLKKL